MPPVKLLTFFIFVLFSCNPTVFSRLILHQSFFPNRYYSSPPSLPPAPTPIPAPSPPSPVQGLPFTPSTSSPSGFFPFSHPSPPPPSSPAATTTAPFVSFPANISSLNVPHSSPPSHKLLSPKLLSLSIVSLFLAVLLLSISLVLFLKRRRLNTANNHTRLDPATENTLPGPPPRPRNDSDRAKNETSSEFLYLGTLVSPATHHQGHLGNNISYGRGRNVKLDSPELRPLPPLANRSQAHAHFADVASSSSSETTSSLPDTDDSSSESLSPKGSASPDVGLTPRREYPTSPELMEIGIPESHLVSKQSYLTTEWISDSNSSLSLSSTPEMNSDKEPVKGNNAVAFVPPPPPPPPLSKKAVGSKPPAFINPSRPFIVKNATGASVLDNSVGSNDENLEKKSEEEEAMKPRLKPLHWDKVRASSGREMVWDHMKSSSFELNEEMIETLFVVNNSKINQKETVRRAVLPSKKQENRVLESKKSQNISILLRALNVTKEDVCGALLEGNAHGLGAELLESLLKMAPTKEEANKLKEYKDAPPFELDPAERFLKAVLDIPSAFERIEAMLYVANFDSEVEYIMKSFETLEEACEELRKSRMFLKLLEAVLKTGNRMNVGTNRGGAQAFKLDTLLKLVDVKGADGKTTLLHFVVQEIIKAEGERMSTRDSKLDMNEEVRYRKLGLHSVAGLSSDLTNVKKAACMDSNVLSNDVSKLCSGIELVEEILRLNGTTTYDESSQKFSESMNTFMKKSEEVIRKIQVQESVSLSAVKKLTAYFHGNSAKEEAHPFRIFMVVRDFLTILDRVCKEVAVINEGTPVNSAHRFPHPVNPTVSPTFRGRQQQYSSSSDDESSSF